MVKEKLQTNRLIQRFLLGCEGVMNTWILKTEMCVCVCVCLYETSRNITRTAPIQEKKIKDVFHSRVEHRSSHSNVQASKTVEYFGLATINFLQLLTNNLFSITINSHSITNRFVDTETTCLYCTLLYRQISSTKRNVQKRLIMLCR